MSSTVQLVSIVPGSTGVPRVDAGVPNLSQTTVFDVESYASIQAAVTAIGNMVATLRISTAQTVTATLTAPATLSFEIVGGGTITISNGVTATFNGFVWSLSTQAAAFPGSGTAVFNGKSRFADTVQLPDPVTPVHGGTGSTRVPTNGQVPIGNGTTYTPATLTAGQNITITNGSGSVTIAGTATAQPGLLFNTVVVAPDIQGQTGIPVNNPAYMVTLVSGDAVTDQNGKLYTLQTPLNCVLANTGAGGTQSAVTTNTWYQLYWISNASGSTQALYAVNQPVEGVSRSPGSVGGSAGILSNTYTKIGTPWTPASTTLVSSLVFNTTASTGISGGYCWITLETDNSGFPSGTVLGTSRPYSRGTMVKAGGAATSATYFPFATSVSLTGGTPYWIVLHVDTLTSGYGVIVDWETATTYNTYGWDGSTWVLALSHQLYFTVNTTPAPTALSLPSGYTQYTQLTWFFTATGAQIYPRQFTARNRTVITNIRLAGEWTIKDVPSNSTPTTWWPTVLIPPTPIHATFSTSVDSSATSGAQGVFVSDWSDIQQIQDSTFCYMYANGSYSNYFTPGTNPVYITAPGINATGLSANSMYVYLNGFEW